MTVLHIEHKVENFDVWKKLFDSDPINRKKSGVTRYWIFRSMDDPNDVVIHLEFNSIDEASETLKALKKMWEKIEGTIMVNPRTRMFEIVESKDL